MSIKIKVAGVWKDLTPKVKVAGAWKTITQVSVKVAGTWRNCLSTGPTVSTTPITSLSNDDIGTVIANVRIGADGEFYKSFYHGGFGSSAGTWLTSGASSQVWVARTITSGTLTTDGIGTGRVVCSTNRTLGVTRVISGTKSCTFTLNFYDAASGGNLLGSKSITTSATNLGGGVGGMGCPLCCFTPDTMIAVP